MTARSAGSRPRPARAVGALALALCLATGVRSPLAAQRVNVVTPEDGVAAQRGAPRDAWLGEDKIQHFATSAALAGFAYGVARNGLEHDASMIAAAGVAAVAGVLKEVHDRRIGRPFSLRDLVWDALGIATGYVWIREIE